MNPSDKSDKDDAERGMRFLEKLFMQDEWETFNALSDEEVECVRRSLPGGDGPVRSAEEIMARALRRLAEDTGDGVTVNVTSDAAAAAIAVVGVGMAAGTDPAPHGYGNGPTPQRCSGSTGEDSCLVPYGAARAAARLGSNGRPLQALGRISCGRTRRGPATRSPSVGGLRRVHAQNPGPPRTF
jgi:hypothetical protein